MTEEHRKTIRHKALKGGRIVFNGGHASVDCTIRNVSESGARLHVDSVLGVPEEFTLMFADGSAPRECLVKWRNPSAIGVEFKPADPSTSPDSP
jgi:hypothetical protein